MEFSCLFHSFILKLIYSVHIVCMPIMGSHRVIDSGNSKTSPCSLGTMVLSKKQSKQAVYSGSSSRLRACTGNSRGNPPGTVLRVLPTGRLTEFSLLLKKKWF